MWTCPKCERTIKNLNQWHNCVKVDMDSLFENKAPILISIFDKLLFEIADWQNVNISTTKNCIVFVKNQTFLIIRPMKKELDIKFYLPNFSDEFPIHKCVEYSGKFETHIRVSELEQISPQVFKLIKTSYNLL
ncbi:DUF5655 domain-containing protein [Flavobacterium sp. TSSA_36]|uniref:DUF5655 domain-containing protein n=1 Tax=Flavobacterium sp. TSSA_36 TaxID=3447669 RepID=UPI003F41A634